MSVQQINDPAIDFSTKLHLCPSYRYNKNIPTSGSKTFTLGAIIYPNLNWYLIYLFLRQVILELQLNIIYVMLILSPSLIAFNFILDPAFN